MRRYYSVSSKTFKNKDGLESTKYFANGVSAGNYSTEDLAKDVSQASSFTEADIIGALRAVSDSLKVRLKMGYNVTLNGIGTFSVSITSEPCQSEKECKPNKVRAKKVAYKADKLLRKELQELKFYKTDPYKNRKKGK